MMIVCMGYDDAQGHPSSVFFGNRLLANRPPAATRNPGTYDIAMSLWLIPRVSRGDSRVITSTWGAAIVERALLVGEVEGKNRIDFATGNNDSSATTDPTTGLTGSVITAGSFVAGLEYQIETIGTTDFTLIGAASNTVGLLFVATGAGAGTGTAREALSETDDFAVAFFVSEGPSNDAAGTLQIKNGGTWTNATGTQRVGTVGAPPVSNVTIQAGWLQLTSSEPTEARIQTATSRLWTSAIVTWKAGLDTRAAISPSDFDDVEQIFEAEVPPLNPEDAAYWFNPVSDQFEVYDKADMTTRIGYWNGGDWITG